MSPFDGQSSTFSNEASQEMENSTEWWKQKRNTPREVKSDTPSCCCNVCHQHLPMGQILRESTSSGMRQNALLAYFKPQTAIVTRESSMPTGTVMAHTSHHCSFCERATCNDCIANCEQCNELFCSFCRTVDYCGSVSKTLCIDCNKEKPVSYYEDDEDAMNIG